MVSPFTLPPTGIGPGSQPDPEGELQYTPMPSGMRTWSLSSPDVDDPKEAEPALEMLLDIAIACEVAALGGAGAEFDLSPLSKTARKVMAEAMGSGEVSMKLRGIPAIMVQESVFAGVWMLVAQGIDKVVVGKTPPMAISRAHAPHRPALGHSTPKIQGVVNAPALLVELMDKSHGYRKGDMPHVINLTLLPHTPEDLDWLAKSLGEGAVTILSRGYGNCRITACAQPWVWRVQFYNSTDQLILDTYEVTEMPDVALAAEEDLSDSAERIREVVRVIR